MKRLLLVPLLFLSAYTAYALSISDITGLQDALDNKSGVSHGHPQTDISGLVALLNLKVEAVHYQEISTINGLQAELDNRSLVNHTHPKSDISGLQTELDAKASSSALSTLQTQVTAMASSTPIITMGAVKTIASLTSATGTMLSSTKTSNVMYSVNIVTTATIGGASGGEILLEVSPTNTATSTWTVINRVKNSQTITLAVALNSIQDITYNIMGNVPSGYYMRLRSNTLSGTPTYSFVTGQEMQF